MRSGRSVRNFVAVALATVTAASGIPAAVAASSSPPSLALRRASGHVTLYKYSKRVTLELGVYAEAVGGNFELAAARPDYEYPPAVKQMDARTGQVLREVPAELVNGWHGLNDFSEVVFRNADGVTVKSKKVDFCPNSYDRQRVSDEGPDEPTYPMDSCSPHFVFAKGMVWGLDHAWAAEVTSSGYGSARMRVPVGEYQVEVRVADAFRDLFDIPADRASAILDVSVVRASYYYSSAGRKLFGASATQAPTEPQAGVPTVTDPEPDTLPDLVALPAWSMGTRHRSRKGKDYLTFAASPWNAGPAPLVVEGFRRAGEDVMDAYQYFYDSEGDVVGRAEVGTFEYDPRRGHFHWHFDQFARFSLLDSSGTEIVASRKQSFCLYPTDPVDLTVPGAQYQPWGKGLGTVCGDERSLWVREELDAGWADTYYQSVAGQSFNITGVPNGWYQVKVEVDPLNLLYQKDGTNDVETRLVRLSGKPGHRRVLMVPWHGIEA